MIEPEPAIATTGLTKDYGGGHGIIDLTLTVHPGEVVGFLGPNGAGKSTTIRLLMGLIRPTGGTARIFGHDCWREATTVKRHLGFAPGERPEWGGLRGAEIVASIAGLRGGVDQRYVTDLCQRLELDLGRRWREYSHGNKQKVLLVIAVMHRPRLLILDEPTTGLDPLMQQIVHALVREARAAGAAVFLSSHVLSEVEQICDRVGIVRAGRLVTLTRLADLHGLRSSHIEIEFAGPPQVEAVTAVAGVSAVTVAGQRLTCTLQGPFAPLQQAIAAHPVLALSSHEPSLEEQFLSFYRPAAGAGRLESG